MRPEGDKRGERIITSITIPVRDDGDRHWGTREGPVTRVPGLQIQPRGVETFLVPSGLSLLCLGTRVPTPLLTVEFPGQGVSWLFSPLTPCAVHPCRQICSKKQEAATKTSPSS